MPFYLRESDVLPRVAGLSSVLIVPCRFCPAASLAVREKKPYIQLFRHFLRTEAYESFIKTLRRRLRDEGSDRRARQVRRTWAEGRRPGGF